jgi:predicted RNA-binding protein YlxR (DUF448 family)
VPEDATRVPERRCLGCGQRAPKGKLVRFVAVRTADGAVLRRDDRGRLGGRGLYVCRREECFERAAKRRAFQRGARLDGVALDLGQASVTAEDSGVKGE